MAENKDLYNLKLNNEILGTIRSGLIEPIFIFEISLYRLWPAQCLEIINNINETGLKGR